MYYHVLYTDCLKIGYGKWRRKSRSYGCPLIEFRRLRITKTVN